MAKIIDNKPKKRCPSCDCTFEYDASDVKYDNEPYWAGSWHGEWQWREVRYIRCPGCGKLIRL